jgi:hypothetical protein
MTTEGFGAERPAECTAMELRDANELLDPGYTRLESGYVRLDDGQLHVAAWTTLFGCKFVGGTHHVHERIGGELQKLKIHFREPGTHLDVSRFEKAGISAAVCARIGLLEAPVWGGHVIHLCRDTDYGCEMRSRFWLGDVDPPELAPDREARIRLFPNAFGEGLLKHCHEEMSYLAGFLPGLYAQQPGSAG